MKQNITYASLMFTRPKENGKKEEYNNSFVQ